MKSSLPSSFRFLGSDAFRSWVKIRQYPFFLCFFILFGLLFSLVKVFLSKYSGSTLLPRGTQVGRVLCYCSFTSLLSNTEHRCSTKDIPASPHREDSVKVTSDTRLLLHFAVVYGSSSFLGLIWDSRQLQHFKGMLCFWSIQLV